MKTYLNTPHEEKVNTKLIGVALNHNKGFDFKELLFYYFNDETQTYIFFKTMSEVIEYTFYGFKNLTRAYIKENIFDDYFDNGIDGKFIDKLEWFE